MKYQSLPFPPAKKSRRQATSEAELNKFDCVPVSDAVAASEGSALKSKTLTNYYFMHSIVANIASACTEAFKFSPGNIV